MNYSKLKSKGKRMKKRFDNKIGGVKDIKVFLKEKKKNERTK